MQTSVDWNSAAKSAKAANVDDLGCPVSGLSSNQKILGNDIKVYRKYSDDVRIGQVATEASNRGFLVGVSNQPGHKRRIFHQRHSTDHDFAEDAIYIRNFNEDYKADISGSFDFALLEFAPTLLSRMLSDSGKYSVDMPVCSPGQLDPVLANLVRALIAASNAAHPPSQLLVDQMTAVIATHISERYGSRVAAKPAKGQGLSRTQERVAKELLRSKLDGKVSVEDVAAACNLSCGHFTRAFRLTTGQSPYNWLIGQRLDLACDLMRDQKRPLAEIAVDCGFADQSHFTRAFSTRAGVSPGNWRRRLL